MRQRACWLAVSQPVLRHLHEKGCEIVYFDKKARARLMRAKPGAAREAAKLTRAYAIMGANGVVITVGHRYRRIARDD